MIQKFVENSFTSTIRLAAADLVQRAAIFVRNEPVEIKITPNERSPKLDYSDFKSALVGDVLEQADRSVRMFLEVLTSQFLINFALRFSTYHNQQPSVFANKFKAVDGIFNFDELTEKLGYSSNDLGKTRFNA